MRITRLLVIAALATACANPPDSQECETGITCPEGTKCAAVQPICITNDCGDGVIQDSVGEVCDDGNVEDGDGCAANCQSREVCGDGVLNAAAGEICDDSNTTGGDGCAADCKSVETCGNGIRDVNEICDDGNTVPGDGCSGNCKSTEICGNNIVDLDEKCDDGGAPGGCNDDCQGGTGCGDGAIDRDGSGNALEECDDGNTDDHDDCTNQCHLNICGDANVQTSGARVEECDPAVDFGETVDCNIDCTSATCGDGKINNALGEECDNGLGNNADDRDCTSLCKVNVCGDTLANTLGPDHKEDCDDGNSNQLDGCSNECTMPECGNGVIEMPEACDDFNTDNGDGCSSDCKFETCGDGIINNGEDCDGTGTATVKGTPGETPTCNLDCTSPPQMCGDGKVNKTAGEQCDDGNTNDSGDKCRNNCKLNVSGDGSKSDTELCDDGNKVNTDSCNNSCTVATCHDGIRQGTEQCDDGNLVDTDGCLSTCVYATCGDGFVENLVEECDNGTANNGVTKNCLPNCKANVCGDGFVDLEGTGSAETEACDDGNTDDESVCPYGIATCSLCSHDCNAVEANLVGPICGDGNVDAGEMCDDNSTVTEATCPYESGVSADGACDVCNANCLGTTHLTNGDFCGDGTVDPGEACDDRNIDACGECNATCSAAQPAAKATGLLIAPVPTNAIDGKTFTVNDGAGHMVTFEFDSKRDGVTAGNRDVDCSTTGTTQDCREAIQDQFLAIGLTFDIDATDLGSTALFLTQENFGTAGNIAITSTITDPDTFFFTGMAGGAAHDCAVDVRCENDADCASGDCGGDHLCN
jgi:cysteine-rich repeat protein